MKPGKRCRCGTRKVTTLDALKRERERCPRCDGVAKQKKALPDDVGVVSQAHIAPPVIVPQRHSRPVLVRLPDRTGEILYERNPDAARDRAPVPPAPPEPRKAKAPRPKWNGYPPRPCRKPKGCGESFTPKSGNQKWCPACQKRIQLADQNARQRGKRKRERRQAMQQDRQEAKSA